MLRIANRTRLENRNTSSFNHNLLQTVEDLVMTSHFGVVVSTTFGLSILLATGTEERSGGF